jgi:hypothetical protein
MPERVMFQQIFKRMDIQLFSEQLSTLRRNTGEVLDRAG